MDDERSDLPEVLSSPPGSRDVDPSDPGRDTVQSGGNGDLPVPQEESSPGEETEPGMDGDQDPQEAMKAWLKGAEGLIFAYWHDPRTAIKYAIAILQVLQKLPEKEILALDPTTIPPITEIEAGWR